MSTDHVSALRLVDEMRSRGVLRFTIGDVSAEFAPVEPKHVPMAKPIDPDLCRCGHSLNNEHNNGLCIAHGGGCDPVKCAPAEAT